MYKKENALYVTILISSIVLFAFIVAFTLTILWYHRKRTSVQKELETRNLQKLEKERRRVAAGLQNILSPLFVTILIRLSELNPLDADDGQALSEIKIMAAGIMVQLQKLSSVLMPRQLEENGLMAALKDLAEAIQETYHLAVYIEDNAIPRLSPEKEIHIYRMVEEVLDNIISHAQASQAFLNISASDKNLTLVISDDGIGLDLKAIKKQGKALGLRNILARADVLDAEIFLEGNEGGGTTYIIEVPVL